MTGQAIFSENKAYWTERAPGYSIVNQTELSSRQRYVWRDTLNRLIRAWFRQSPEELRVLDVGTGPGFFATILAETG